MAAIAAVDKKINKLLTFCQYFRNLICFIFTVFKFAMPLTGRKISSQKRL
jgi:hypothetical protein